MKHAAKARAMGVPVAGKLAPLPSGLEWNQRNGRQSRYAQLLEDLRKAPHGHGIWFASTKCRAPIAARAKKLKLAVEFAEQNGALWVRRVSEGGASAPAAHGPVSSEPKSDGNGRSFAPLTDTILDILKTSGPLEPLALRERVLRRIPTTTPASIQQTCFTLKSRGLITHDGERWATAGGKVA